MNPPRHSERAAWVSHEVYQVLGDILRFVEGKVLLSVEQLNTHLDGLTKLFDSSDANSHTLTGSHDDAGKVLDVLEKLRGDPSMPKLVEVTNRVPMQSFIQAHRAVSLVYVQKAHSDDRDRAIRAMLDRHRWIWYTSDDQGKRTALLCARALTDYYHHRPDEFMAFADMVVATLNARAGVPRHSKERLNGLLDDLITLWRDLFDKYRHRDDLWGLQNAFSVRYTQILKLMHQLSMQTVNQNAITAFVGLILSIPEKLFHAGDMARAERVLAQWYDETPVGFEKDNLRGVRCLLRPFLSGEPSRKRRRRLDTVHVQVELRTDPQPTPARPVDVNPDAITDLKIAAADTAHLRAEPGASVQLVINHAFCGAGSELVSASVLRVCQERDGLKAGEMGTVLRLDRGWCEQSGWARVVKSLPEMPA